MFGRVLTTVAESASAGESANRRNRSRNGLQSPPDEGGEVVVFWHTRIGRQKCRRVAVPWSIDDAVDVAGLHDVATVDDCNLVANETNNAKIVAHE